MKRNQKWKITHKLLGRQNLCFCLHKNRELKAKLWWAGARERKKSAFFLMFISSKERFFNIFVLSWSIVYWINYQNIYNFVTKKRLLHTLSSFFLKSSKTFSVSLRSLFWLPMFSTLSSINLSCSSVITRTKR